MNDSDGWQNGDTLDGSAGGDALMAEGLFKWSCYLIGGAQPLLAHASIDDRPQKVVEERCQSTEGVGGRPNCWWHSKIKIRDSNGIEERDRKIAPNEMPASKKMRSGKHGGRNSFHSCDCKINSLFIATHSCVIGRTWRGVLRCTSWACYALGNMT